MPPDFPLFPVLFQPLGVLDDFDDFPELQEFHVFHVAWDVLDDLLGKIGLCWGFGVGAPSGYVGR